MQVIDVDSHFYEPFEWLTDTDPELATELPDIDKVTLVATTAFGEVLSTLPPQYRPDPMDRVPAALRGTDGKLSPEALTIAEAGVVGWLNGVPGAHKPADRIAFLDAQGIDQQWVLPTFAFNPIAYMRREKPELTGRLLSAYNRWASSQLEGYTDRLLPVTVIDLKTMTKDVVLREMRLSRERGARSFLFWPSPVEGKSISHPDFDWFWAAADDLGLMPMVHVGASRPQIDLGWLNNGREYPLSLLSYLGQLHQIPEIVLSELLAAGTFERYPNLRVLICELGLDWLPTFVRRVDGLARHTESQGAAWPYPMRPSEYLRRNVRVSPLAHDPVASVIEQVGDDMVIFSSDYPHPEGGSDATSVFRTKLEGKVTDSSIARFFGGTIAEDLAVSA